MSKKRGNHEGNVRYRPQRKQWQGEIQVGYHLDGRRRRVTVYGQTRKSVVEKLDRIKQDLTDGINLTDKPSFLQVAELWLAQHKVAASTHKQYEYLLNPILKEFGTREISGILPYELEAFLIRISQDHSDSYISKLKAVLNMVFHKATVNKWIRSNPCADLEEIKSQISSKPRAYFTLEEMKTLFFALPEDRLGDSIRLLKGTGIRLGELLATSADSFNDDCSIYHVHRAVKQVGGKITIGTPKSKSSLRDIVIPEAFRPAAMRLRDLCKDGGYLWEAGIPGQPCHESHFRKEFKRSVESVLGPTSKTPHMMRHGFATAHATVLKTPKIMVHHMLGHSLRRINTDTYFHCDIEAQKTAAAAYSELFMN